MQTVNRLFQQNSLQLARDHLHLAVPYYQEHFIRSQEAIARSISGLAEEAIVLGAGRGFDLPLSRMATQLKKIILVDMDSASCHKGLEELPRELRGKFNVESFDLTGLFSQVSNLIQEIIAEVPRPSFLQFKVALKALLSTIQPKKFREGDKKDFVCSSMVCSQLVGNICQYLELVIGESFGEEALGEDLYDTLSDWLLEIQINHIRDLNRLVNPQGRVYFADHFSEGDEMFAGAEAVQKAIGDFFVIREEHHWDWSLPSRVYEIAAAGGDTTLLFDENKLNRYHVTSLILEPRKN